MIAVVEWTECRGPITCRVFDSERVALSHAVACAQENSDQPATAIQRDLVAAGDFEAAGYHVSLCRNVGFGS